jgi:hypothetical protein
MGRSIIISTVRYGLGFSGLEKKFHETFQRYVGDKLSNPELASPAFWIAVSNAAPLALNQLFECVFAPYASDLLIAQDLAVDEGKASIVREHSKAYGELIIDANTEDGLLDDIIQSIMHTDLEASISNPFYHSCCHNNGRLGHRSLEYNSSSRFCETQTETSAQESSPNKVYERKCEGRYVVTASYFCPLIFLLIATCIQKSNGSNTDYFAQTALKSSTIF